MNDDQHTKPTKIDTESATSSRHGVAGLVEVFLRKFKVLFHLLALLPLYAVASACLGAALMPGVLCFRFAQRATMARPMFIQDLAYAVSIAAGYFLYGFTLIFLVAALNVVFRTSLKPWRGPYYSLEVLKWYIHNGLTYLPRYTFLEFITPTPFNLLFYRMMGMKIGEGVQINTVNISDPSLISLGNLATIGGSATIVAHYGQGGFLVLSPVVIGDKCTVGLRATIMGGVVMEPGSKVLPNSVVLPKTVIPAGETWGGVPAKRIEIIRERSAA